MTYDTIHFPFQVHNDASVSETAYLTPEHLPFGTRLEVTPSSAAVEPGTAVVFHCTLTVDDQIIRPGCDNDQGFLLTAWRVANDADERWGSCFYWLRPRVRTRLDWSRGSWYEDHFVLHGVLSLDTDTSVQLASQLPLSVRIRVDVENDGDSEGQWHTVPVQPGGGFFLVLSLDAPGGAIARSQAWFDRTDLLASSRSGVWESKHALTPVIQ
ncbi:hypothetical protein [Pseudarthrobacter sp. SSS035]|uniref:hypothetical protein n=1 Tax=Pseudarthrobacter sp. SSS035 TaxID=2931399 RepID=UPI00200CC537|nr:hypothetical protein [Pseudarthrobacter sp. SSS035]